MIQMHNWVEKLKDSFRDTRFRLKILFLVLGMGIGVLCVLWEVFGTWQVTEYRIYDSLLRYKTKEKPHREIVLVKIDDISLKMLKKKWPWERSVFSDNLRKIAAQNPKLMALNLTFSDPGYSSKGDRDFSRMLKETGNHTPVILGSSFYYTSDSQIIGKEKISIIQEGIDLPLPAFREYSYHGFINLPADRDGFIRRTVPVRVYQNKIYSSFAFKVVQKFLDIPYGKIEYTPYEKIEFGENRNIPLDSQDAFLINYHLPDRFKSVSFFQVYLNLLPKDYFKDKLVLIGPDFIESSRFYFTPFFQHQNLKKVSSGLEIQASIIDTLLQKNFITHSTKTENVLTLIILNIMLLAGFHYFRKIRYFFLYVVGLSLLYGAYVSGNFFVFSSVKPAFLPFLNFLVFMGGMVLAKQFGEIFTQNLKLQNLNRDLDHKVEERTFQLANSEEKFRLLATQTPGIFYLFSIGENKRSVSGKLDYISPGAETIMGWDVRDLTREVRFFFRQIHPDDFSKFLKIFNNEQSVFRFRHRSGKYIWLHGKAARIFKDHKTGKSKWAGFFVDITEEKKTQEKLSLLNSELSRARDKAMEANRAKTIFLANMSHEFRTPMNSIIGYTEILKEELEEKDPKLYEDIKRIQVSSQHLLSLLNNVLDISKIEAGKMEIFYENFNLPALIRELINTFSPMIEQNRNTLTLKIDPVVGEYYCDYLKIKQVLLNLLSNACKFTQNGQIGVEVSLCPGNNSELCIEVWDTGIGMNPEQMGNIFLEFKQADPAISKKFGGTGLGLSLSLKLAHLLGGNLQAFSEGSGKGSRFLFRLPYSPYTDSLSPKVIVSESDDRSLKNSSLKNILLIEDDVSIQNLVAFFFKYSNFMLHKAHDGEKGVLKAGELKPDLIFLDVNMPKLNGWEVLKRLKTENNTRNIPVIMLTGESDRKKSFLLGASDFIIKPDEVNREKILGMVEKHLELH